MRCQGQLRRVAVFGKMAQASPFHSVRMQPQEQLGGLKVGDVPTRPCNPFLSQSGREQLASMSGS